MSALVFALLFVIVATPARADDEKIVEAAMVSVFSKDDWVSITWNKGDVVLVAPEWRGKTRPVFRKAVEEATPPLLKGKFEQRLSKERADVATILAKSGIGSEPTPPLTNLKAMKLDSRVVVGTMEDSKQNYGWISGSRFVAGLRPKRTIRVPFQLYPPGYSPNGKYAVLNGTAPWSIHSSDITFILERAGDVWKVVKVLPRYYA